MLAPAKNKALVLAPHGRDGPVAASLLQEVAIGAVICPDLPEMVARLDDDISFLVIAEEAIRNADLKDLVQWIDSQPAWSDLPVILIVSHGGGPEKNPAASRHIDNLGNVSFIERPFHPMTFVSIARTALRGRRRQYEARARLEQIRESEDRLDNALKAGRLGAFEYDVTTRELITSANCKSHFGRRPDEAFAYEDLEAAIHKDDRVRVEAGIVDCLDSGKDYASEFRVVHPDTTQHWVDVRARCLQNDAGQSVAMVGVSADITARKNAEAQLKALNETLENRVVERTRELELAHAAVLNEVAERERAETILRQSQKMETVGQLTGGIAHDFNNLLMAVLGNLDLLRKYKTDARSSRLIDGAIQGARRGASLTQRLLAFSRQQDLDIRPVDLVALITGMEDLLRRSLGPSVRLEYSLPPGLPTALADANQVEMALLNLAVNARDAMADGGSLRIAVDARMRSGDTARFLVISVADTGTGMDEATLARAIEPFYSTKELGKGTGLGLSMVHGLAVQLEGELKLESTPGKGTTAELWLPESGDLMAAEDKETPPAATPGDAPRKARILFVDDDALIAMSTVDMLEDLGHNVLEANSGLKALEILKSDNAIDLLITDHAMPRMTGSQLAKAARELHPNLPVLLATGYADLPDGEGADLPRITKPYDQAQIDTEIRKLLAAVR